MDRPLCKYHWSVNGHSGCFCFLAIVNNTAECLNTSFCVDMCFWGIFLGVELDFYFLANINN